MVVSDLTVAVLALNALDAAVLLARRVCRDMKTE